MQNWNQWQISTGAVTSPMPQPPVGYAAPGADPMAMMQAYMQYYNQPAPSGYTAEQWAAAQQQNWAQWQQWQQQYQQWQAQYGEKYQETMKHMSAQNLGLMNQVPPLPNVQPPPLPKEDSKPPPLPPNTLNAYQFTSMPPPHQNNLPLFPVKQPPNSTIQNMPNCPQNPPLPSSQPPLPPECSSSNSADSSNSKETVSSGKRASSTVSESSSAKKLKIEEEDLTEAEKTFDAQFKQWEEQFNKWKQQNANHPDKTQYKQYEAKWTSWREKLIERREQMRKKREQQKQAAAKVEADKGKSLPGDDKILNILSNTENQGLINNLLGIGKTLGLTGKQNTSVPPPPPPPPPTQTTTANIQATTLTSSSQASSQLLVSQSGLSTSSSASHPSWSTQQWTPQYQMGMSAQSFPNLQSITGVPPPPFGAPPTQLPPLNFTQPPPSFSTTPNFSQPPPGFSGSDLRHSRPPMQSSVQGRSLFGPNDVPGSDDGPLGSNECPNQPGHMNNFDTVGPPSHFGMNEYIRQKEAAGPADRFGRDNMNKNVPDYQANQFRANDSFGLRPDNYKLTDDRAPEQDHFNRDDRGYQDQGLNRFNSQKMNFSPGTDRFGSGNDRFGQGNDHCGPNNDRFGPGNDRFGPGSDRFAAVGNRFGPPNDRYGSGNERYAPDRFGSGMDRPGPGNDRFGPGNERFGFAGDRFGPNNDRFGNDRFGPGHDRYGAGSDRLGPGSDRLGQGNDRIEPSNDRFSAAGDRFGSNNEHFGPGSDKFNRNALDRFDQKDAGDNRRDSFANNNRGFNRQFEPSDELAPELKKLMEKRRAAMDVFRPSFLDSDRSSGGSSLSESFKKIAGDSLFASKNLRDSPQKDYSPKGNNFGPRGLPSFGPAGPGFRMPPPEFRPPGDFKHQGGPDFGPRGPPGFGPRGNFDSRDGLPPAFRPPVDFDERIGKDFEYKPSSPNNKSDVKNASDSTTAEKGDLHKESTTTEKKEAAEGVEQKGSVKTEQETDQAAHKDSSENIPLLEKPPWVDAEFPESNIPQRGTNEQQNENTPTQDKENAGKEQENDTNTVEKKDTQNSGDGGISKKSEILPFMGENDPKPEDLNMEPPPELPNLGPISSDLNSESTDVMSRADQSFETKGSIQPFPPNPEYFGPRGIFEGPPGPRGMPFRPNAPPPFGPRGPNDGRLPMFDTRTPAPFPFNSSDPNSHQLGPPRPNDGQFGPRGTEEGQFGSRGPSDSQFRPRAPSDGQFGPRGPNYRQFPSCRPDAPFMSRGNDTQFGPRGNIEGQFGFPNPNDRFFGTRRPTDGQRGPNDGVFGSRESQLPNRDMKEGSFNLRGFNERQFDNQGPSDGYFGPQSGNDRFFGSRGSTGGPNDLLYMSRNRSDEFNRSFSGRGAGDFRSREQFDNAAYPSTTRDRPDTSQFGFKSGDLSDKYLDANAEKGGTDSRGDGGCDIDRSKMESNDKMQTDQNTEQTGWRQSYSKNSFGDIDQRPVHDVGNVERSSHSSTEIFNQNPANNADQRSLFGTSKSNIITDKMRLDKGMIDSPTIASLGEYKSGYGDTSSGSDFGKFGSPNNLFAKRSLDSRQSQVRCPVVKEFCIEKQFNYNHGGATVDKKFIEHIPVKIIDYAHISRSSIQDHLTPVQCFDYGHGNLKPVIPDREVYPKKDFRHWEESEQNLKEYTERIRRYECYVGKRDSRRSMDYRQRRESEGSLDDRRSDREKREKEEYKIKDRTDERIYERKPEKDQDNRYQNDRSNVKERTQEMCEASQKESNKDPDKAEDRSKGSINWQDSSNKNTIETKPPENSVSDAQHNVLEAPPKTLELAKTPNCTMVDDLLCPPGRQNRPPKIAIILRGPPGSGKSFVAKLIKDKEVEQGGSAPRILSLDDYFLVEKEIESKDDNGKKVTVKEMVYEYEDAMEQSYVTSLVKAFKKNITDGFFNFIILDCINEKISDYEEMWSFAKTKGFKVYVCEMEMDLQICLKRNIHNRTEEEINRIIDYFEPTPSYHQKLDVNSMLQEQAIEEVHMEDSQEPQENVTQQNEDSQDSQEDATDTTGVSKWERMEAEDKLDRLDGLAKKKNESKVQTMKDFLQVPDYYNMEDTSGKKRVRWADLEERKEQEKMRAVGFVVGHTNWDRMMDPTKGGSALTRTKFFSLS